MSVILANSLSLNPMEEEQKQYVDPALLKELRQRKASAIAQVIKDYNGYLLRAALGHRFTQQESEEIVSNTWAAFFESIHRFEGRSKIKTFLYGILFNKIREFRRELSKGKKEISLDEVLQENFNELGNFKTTPLSPEKFLSAAQDRETIRDCLEKLSDPYKTAFYLKEVEGESTQDICETLGVSPNNLNVILFRARNKLRTCIESKAIQEAKLRKKQSR